MGKTELSGRSSNLLKEKEFERRRRERSRRGIGARARARVRERKKTQLDFEKHQKEVARNKNEKPFLSERDKIIRLKSTTTRINNDTEVKRRICSCFWPKGAEEPLFL